MMRIAMIGDSHLAPYANTWKEIESENRDLSIEFFPTNDNYAKALRLVKGKFAREFNLIRLQEHRNEIVDVDAYDAYVIVALEFSFRSILRVYSSHRTLSMQDSTKKFMVSDRCFETAARGHMLQSIGGDLLTALSAITKKPIVLIPQPLFSNHLLNATLPETSPLVTARAAMTGPDATSLENLYDKLIKSLQSDGFCIFEQNVDTRQGFFTRGEFSLAHPPQAGNSSFEANDFHHMSTRYGELMMQPILTYLRGQMAA